MADVWIWNLGESERRRVWAWSLEGAPSSLSFDVVLVVALPRGSASERSDRLRTSWDKKGKLTKRLEW